MDTLTWVIVTNACVWAGLGLYLLFLGSRQRALVKHLDQLEALGHE